MDDRKYTLENIETLREKTGVGYGEAVRLLEKYEGDIPRALVELEMRGELKNGRSAKGMNKNEVEGFLKTWWDKGCDTHIIVERKKVQLVNLPVLFMILALLLGWKLVAASAILALVLGCHMRVQLPEDEKKAAEPEADMELPEEEEVPEPAAQTPVTETKDGGYSSITVE